MLFAQSEIERERAHSDCDLQYSCKTLHLNQSYTCRDRFISMVTPSLLLGICVVKLLCVYTGDVAMLLL